MFFLLNSQFSMIPNISFTADTVTAFVQSQGSSNPQQPRITHHPGGSWITMPATVQQQQDGRLEFLIPGHSGTPSMHLTADAEAELRETTEKLLTLPPPVAPGFGRSQLSTEVHVNIHTGHAVWQWHHLSLLLNPEGFSQNFPHLGASFVDFIVANTPQNVLSSIPVSSGGTADAFGTHGDVVNRIGAQPPEVLVNIGSKLSAADLKALTRSCKEHSIIFKDDLKYIEKMIHAGTEVVSDHNGNPLPGTGGEPMREHPTVRGLNMRPVVDRNGQTVRQPDVKEDLYFQTRRKERLPMLDQNGERIFDSKNQPVLQSSAFSAVFYEDVLWHVENGIKPVYQQSALNELTKAFRANPVPEYTPVITNLRAQMATFPQPLLAALQSESTAVRNWALERIADAFAPLQILNVFPDPDFVAQQAIIYNLLINFPGYQPTVTVTRDSRNQEVRTVEYGRFHKTMLYSPDARIADLGNAYSGMMPDFIDHTYHFQTDRRKLDRQNSVHCFPVVANDQGHPVEFKIPDHYDSWLRSQSLEEQRHNLNCLVDFLKNQNRRASIVAPSVAEYLAGIRNDQVEHGPIIAYSVAKYLVRNIAEWPTRQIERLLFSDSVLDRFFSRERTAFIAALSQSISKTTGAGQTYSVQIPARIVAEVETRMRIIHRNEWSLDGYCLAQRLHFTQFAFANWASARRIDLPLLSGAPPLEQDKQINLYADSNPYRFAEAQKVLAWLTQNASDAPQ